MCTGEIGNLPASLHASLGLSVQVAAATHGDLLGLGFSRRQHKAVPGFQNIGNVRHISTLCHYQQSVS